MSFFFVFLLSNSLLCEVLVNSVWSFFFFNYYLGLRIWFGKVKLLKVVWMIDMFSFEQFLLFFGYLTSHRFVVFIDIRMN